MSEKRFKIYQDSIRKFESNRVWGVKSETNSLEPYMTFKEAEKCCDLLNELVEENEQLKEERDYFERRKCEYFNKYNKKHLDNIQLTEENKQLKQEIIVYKKAFQEQVQRCSL